jgi:hypothetical protein
VRTLFEGIRTSVLKSIKHHPTDTVQLKSNICLIFFSPCPTL